MLAWMVKDADESARADRGDGNAQPAGEFKGVLTWMRPVSWALVVPLTALVAIVVSLMSVAVAISLYIALMLVGGVLAWFF